jgi:hypothetical protein
MFHDQKLYPTVATVAPKTILQPTERPGMTALMPNGRIQRILTREIRK